MADEHYLFREVDRLSIDSASYAGIAKRAALGGWSVVFVHCHPGGLVRRFSEQDDREEPRLHTFLAERAPGSQHGSLLLAGTSEHSDLVARVWIDGRWVPMRRVRVLGTRFRFIDDASAATALPEFYARQVQAFGPQIQRLLGHLHVGVVGDGGNGSAVSEQLYRLGVGRISLFDRDVLDESNATRVYGSTVAMAGTKKVAIGKAHGERIGLGTDIRAYPEHITVEATARRLRECDVVFNCTDTQSSRGILVQLALRYLIPVFDLGVKIDSVDRAILGIYGRVTTLLPGEACLFCRGRISAKIIALESLPVEQREALAAERYAPEIETDDPAVITFTTAVAAQAVTELLHRLTGFMGDERRSTETLIFFHQSTMRTNRAAPDPECLCAQRELWGRGDSHDFLGLSWAA